MPNPNKTSQEEYEKRVTSTSNLSDDAQRMDHLDALIDYKLGKDFPAKRREEMQNLDRKMNGKFLGFLVWSALTAKLPLNSENISISMAARLLKKYKDVLTEDEIKIFFADSLPIPIPSKKSPKP